MGGDCGLVSRGLRILLCCAVREEKCFFIMKQFWGNDRLFLLLFFVIFRQNVKILCPL